MGQSKFVNKRTENTWGNQKPYTEEGQTIRWGNQKPYTEEGQTIRWGNQKP